MSLDLKDLKRLKITAETDAWLTAESRSTGKSKQDVLRDAAHAIALEKIHAARLLSALAPSDGQAGDTPGNRGDAGGRRR